MVHRCPQIVVNFIMDQEATLWSYLNCKKKKHFYHCHLSVFLNELPLTNRSSGFIMLTQIKCLMWGRPANGIQHFHLEVTSPSFNFPMGGRSFNLE